MRALLSKNIRMTTSVLGLVLCFSRAGDVRADDVTVYHKILHSIGWIYMPGRSSDGTCWVVDRAQKLVVTNMHVVGDQEVGEIVFPMYRAGQLVTSAHEYLKAWPAQAIKAKMLYRDVKRDLALLQLETLPDGIHALALAARSASKDERILSVGNSGLSQKPLEQAELWTLRTGNVLGKAFRAFALAKSSQNLQSSMINSTVHSRPGDSGGPVVNEAGELVAVTSSGNDNDSFAIDVSEVREFLRQATQSRRLRPDASTLAGSWTVGWANSTGTRYLAGLTLRADGTCMWEENKAYEGTYRFENGRLTLNLPAMRFQITVEVRYDGGDRVQFTGERIEYTMERR